MPKHFSSAAAHRSAGIGGGNVGGGSVGKASQVVAALEHCSRDVHTKGARGVGAFPPFLLMTVEGRTFGECFVDKGR